MVKIVRRRIGGGTYYYLRYGRDRERYLGKTIENPEEIRRNAFMELWLPTLEKIRTSYMKALKSKPKSVIEKELEDFAIRFTYNTNRIEGSTLTLQDTAALLAEGRTPSNKPLHDVIEALAHKRIFSEMLEDRSDLNLDKVLEWHKNLFRETKPDLAGKIRDYGVGIRGSRYKPPAHGIRTLLEQFFEWYKDSKDINAVERAALMHFRFVSIHPFGDGNGRISRLMMNHMLFHSKCPMLVVDYNDRRSYYRALERSNLKDDEIIFMGWYMRRYCKAQNRFLA